MFLADINWEEMLHSLPGILTVTFLFGGWIIVAIVGSIAKNWRRVHESEHQAALKQSMIERGMSAGDIERVLRAGPGYLEESWKDDTTELTKKLAEHGVPGPACEQIVGTYRNISAGEKKTMLKTVTAMLDGGAESEQVLAVVRALGRPASPDSAQERSYRDDPASFQH
jgi:hypothetical protein